MAEAQILVVDDGSRDQTGPRAAKAGADVVRHPYTKGNGAAVKTGIRRAQGEFVLIIDADFGLPRCAPRAPARVSAPAAERLLDANHHDARVH